jgi:putative membrane protein
MPQSLVRIIALAISVAVLAEILPGVRISGLSAAFAVSVVYAFFNFLFFRVLLLFTFPLVILKYLTLGFVGILLNMLLINLADSFVAGFRISNLISGFLFALGISLTNIVVSAWQAPRQAS